MGERILITGGAGFVGSHLAASHRASGDEVHILVRPGGPVHRLRLPLGGVTVHRVRLEHAASIAECLAEAQPTVIYHLASGTGRNPALPPLSPVAPILQDLTNLLTLLAAVAEMRMPPRILIRAGSLAEYGNGPVPSHESQREDPLTTYTTAMVAGLHYSRMLQPRLPFPVATARFALVYGPGQSDDYFVPWLMRRCLAGEPSEVSRPGCRRDMIYVADLVEGLRAMAGANLAGGTVLNLSTGIAPSVREIAQMVVEACRADPALVTFREEMAPNFRVEALHGVPDRARELLGWSARTELRDGLLLCVSHASERLSA